MGNLNEAFEKIGEIRNFDEWEVGDEELVVFNDERFSIAYNKNKSGDEELVVFNDAAILIELAEGREVKVRVLAGECTHINLNLNLLEEINE